MSFITHMHLSANDIIALTANELGVSKLQNPRQKSKKDPLFKKPGSLFFCLNHGFSDNGLIAIRAYGYHLHRDTDYFFNFSDVCFCFFR